MGKVLVVDDDASIVLLLQRIIARKGHQTIVARNGWEGFNKARSELPDLIFTDMRMPDLDGMELSAMLKSDPQLAHIPVIILSGTAYLIELEDTYADDILTKPFDLKTVYAKLERFLDHARTASNGDSPNRESALSEVQTAIPALPDSPPDFSSGSLH